MKTRTRPSAHRGVRASERGAVSAEAVIVLPVLVLLFVGTVLVGRLAVSRADAEAEARSCAWQYSRNACESVPPGCERILGTPSTASVTNAISEKLDDGARRIRSGAGGKSGVIGRIVESIVGSALGAAFGRSFDAVSERQVPRPAFLGKGEVTIHGRYHLACNLASQSMDSVAEQAWKIFRP